MASNSQQNNPGLYIPSTQIWDVDVENGDSKELLLRLYQNLNSMAIAVNIADKGYYVLNEFVTGQQFFNRPGVTSSTNQQPSFRPSFRKTFNFGQLLVNGVNTQPHGLNIPNPNQYTFTRIYGTANDNTNRMFLPLPYASVSGDDIELSLDATNIIITTASLRDTFFATVVVEFLRN